MRSNSIHISATSFLKSQQCTVDAVPYPDIRIDSTVWTGHGQSNLFLIDGPLPGPCLAFCATWKSLSGFKALKVSCHMRAFSKLASQVPNGVPHRTQF